MIEERAMLLTEALVNDLVRDGFIKKEDAPELKAMTVKYFYIKVKSMFSNNTMETVRGPVVLRPATGVLLEQYIYKLGFGINMTPEAIRDYDYEMHEYNYDNVVVTSYSGMRELSHFLAYNINNLFETTVGSDYHPVQFKGVDLLEFTLTADKHMQELEDMSKAYKAGAELLLDVVKSIK